MSWGDAALLGLAVLAMFLPGALVLGVGLRRSWLESLTAAPAVSIAICYLTAMAAALLHVSWGAIAVAVGTVVLTGLSWLARRRWSWLAAGERPFADRRAALLPVVGVLAAVAVGLWTFMNGLGHLSVLPQEHDMVVHTELVGRILRTGQAAPWQSSPTDMITGTPGGFYPNGMHMVAALAAVDPAHSVAALNAVTAVLFALVLPIGMAALATLVSPPEIRPAAAAAAALISVVAYRPTFAFLHDGGVLSQAAVVAITPGVIYAAILAGTGRRSGALVTVAAGLVGATVLHPTAAPIIGLTAGVWILATLVARERGVRILLRRIVGIAVAAVVAVLALVPFLLTGSTAAGFVTSFPRGSGIPFGNALGTTLSFFYGGYYDPSGLLTQWTLAIISLIGLLVCVYRRTNLPLLASLAVWWLILMVWLVKPGVPLITSLGGLFYNSFGRMAIALSMLQWLTAAAAVGFLATLVARGVRALATRRATGDGGGIGRRLPAVAAALTVLALLFMAIPYAQVNSLTLQQRYRHPEFIRVSEPDLAAARYLAKHVRPGERVMNSANDGSTYGYIFYGVPIVESYTAGSFRAQYTTDLLMHVDDVARMPKIRDEVCDMDIAWVVADKQAPLIGAPASVTPLGEGKGVFATPPGFRDLDHEPVFQRVFRQGTVSVYQVDRGALGCSKPASP